MYGSGGIIVYNGENMHDFRHTSFDTRGFSFALVFLAIIIAAASGVHYGTARASEYVVRAESSVAAAAVALPQTSIAHAEAATEPVISVEAVPPKTTAKAYLIADLESGVIYASKDMDTPYPIASISKLLTALVAREAFPAGATTTITNDDRRRTEGTPGSISRTETFLVSDALYPLLMESNNSVAFALARTYGESDFIHLLLRKAHAIGMDSTLMDDPTGLSSHNEASARDLLALIRAVADVPELLTITRTPQKTITAESGHRYSFGNFNVFTGNPAFLGGKTGYTDEARETMVALFAANVKNVGERKVAIIVLGSSDRKQDVTKLLAWFASGAQVVRN